MGILKQIFEVVSFILDLFDAFCRGVIGLYVFVFGMCFCALVFYFIYLFLTSF